MLSRRSLSILTIIVSLASAQLSAHEHTHVGRNPDGIRGNADDNQLWVFATPAQPQWDPIAMIPTGEYIGDKQIYIAELDCWHSAHPQSGSYQLGGYEPGILPDWRISLRRISFSDPVHFWMENEATGQEILRADNDLFALGNPIWDDSLYNENGTLGAWSFHTHTEFVCLANSVGETYTATFALLDTGTTGFATSAPYAMQFITVPEPASLLLALASMAGLRSSIASRRKG